MLGERDRTPLYRLVADEIRQGIKAGTWQQGQKLPSEPQLAREYAVSRATVREALRCLEQEGVVQARHGNGTFVAQPAQMLQVGIDSLYSLTDAIRLQGRSPGTSEAVFRTVVLSGEFALRFHLPPDAAETAHVIARTRLADGQPVAFSQDTVPSRYLPGEWQERVRYDSLFNLLLESGRRLSFATTQLSAVEAPDAVAERLDVKPGRPLLMMREIVCDSSGQPIVCSEDFYRTDRIEVSVVRRRTG
ncbi:MAG TPA: GntR family transcriptional regulator [Symbiobacteriaceae bacterium]|nr:GntR family transcriptional regulator [Symbiobacteriaceae bacterium]